VEIVTRTKASRIDMALSPDERNLSLSSRMIIDATTPFEWKDDPQAGTPIGSPERTRATLERWGWLLKE
jgi:hypothetical protein